MQAEELTGELPKGLIKWYEFDRGSRALFVSGGIEACEVLGGVLEESDLKVDYVDLNEVAENWLKNGPTYKYILSAGILERSQNPGEVLRVLRRALEPNGRMLLAMDNRLGVRYFCGEKDCFTGHIFDSIENYSGVHPADREKMRGRAYAKAEIIKMLEEAGFCQYRFYSVLPSLTRPQVLYAEDFLPEEELDVRVTPQYDSPNTVFLEEERLYTTLIQNGLFHAMANGFLIECSLDGTFSNMKQVTVSMDRGERDGLLTTIRRDNRVEKRALYAHGQEKLKQLYEYTVDLKAHGVNMVDASLINGAFVMPYVKGEPATEYFRRLLRRNKELFIEELDRFWEIIKHSSEHVPYEDVDWENFDPAWQYGEGTDIPRDQWRKIAFGNESDKNNIGVILKRGYLDLVSLNCFFTEGDFVFYDQEFYLKNLPANAILMRTIDFIYWGDRWQGERGNTEMEAAMPRSQLQERYHLNEYQGLWHAFSDYFMYHLTNGETLSKYHHLYRRNPDIVKLNRYRMNYSEHEYQHFQNIFSDIEGKRIYLFGSGSYSKQFLRQFACKYPIAGIFDNSPDKWGHKLWDIPIMSPDVLSTLPLGTYRIFICIRECQPIITQLEKMGIQDYRVYDYKVEQIRRDVNEGVCSLPMQEKSQENLY